MLIGKFQCKLKLNYVSLKQDVIRKNIYDFKICIIIKGYILKI